MVEMVWSVAVVEEQQVQQVLVLVVQVVTE
jgi:hypothetical protein